MADRLVEIVELPGHPWFVASQFHPEFKSRPSARRRSSAASSAQHSPAHGRVRPSASRLDVHFRSSTSLSRCAALPRACAICSQASTASGGLPEVRLDPVRPDRGRRPEPRPRAARARRRLRARAGAIGSYERREIFEATNKALSFVPTSEFPWFRHWDSVARAPVPRADPRRNAAVAERVLGRIRDEGPLSSNDFEPEDGQTKIGSGCRRMPCAPCSSRTPSRA